MSGKPSAAGKIASKLPATGSENVALLKVQIECVQSLLNHRSAYKNGLGFPSVIQMVPFGKLRAGSLHFWNEGE